MSLNTESVAAANTISAKLSGGEIDGTVIMLGSVTRAAILGSTYPLSTNAPPGHFQDVDIAHGSGVYKEKYHTKNGGYIDFRPSRHFTTSQKGDDWTLCDVDGTPLVGLNLGALGLYPVSCPELGIKSWPTPDACTHVALQSYYDAYMNVGGIQKHKEQLSELSERAKELCMGCDAPYISRQIANAISAMNPRRRSPYERFRNRVYKTSPRIAHYASGGAAGKLYRMVRGSEPELPPLPTELTDGL